VTTTVTVEVDEDELTAAAGLLGTRRRCGSWWPMPPRGRPTLPISVLRLLSVRPPTGPRIGDRSRVPD
jgi:hypothetical protein